MKEKMQPKDFWDDWSDRWVTSDMKELVLQLQDSKILSIGGVLKSPWKAWIRFNAGYGKWGRIGFDIFEEITTLNVSEYMNGLNMAEEYCNKIVEFNAISERCVNCGHPVSIDHPDMIQKTAEHPDIQVDCWSHELIDGFNTMGGGMSGAYPCLPGCDCNLPNGNENIDKCSADCCERKAVKWLGRGTRACHFHSNLISQEGLN